MKRKPTGSNSYRDTLVQAPPLSEQGKRNLSAAMAVREFLFDLKNGQDLIEQLNAELGQLNDEAGADRLEQWLDWATELVETRAEHAQAQAAVANYDATNSGTLGWWVGVEAWQHKRDSSAARLVELESGPQ